MSGRPEMAALLKSVYLQCYASDLHAVFTKGKIYSIKAAYNRIWLIWGYTLTGSACRVKGVKIGLSARNN